jgi:hypothetical protein
MKRPRPEARTFILSFLRRYYPDQVHGFDLRLLENNHPVREKELDIPMQE